MINIEELRRLIRYDETDGQLYWNERPREMFSKRRFWLTWNTRYAGKPALAAIDNTGYKHGRIFDKKHYAHRVIVALATGEWPDSVDHIDGNVSNNAILNLRAVSHEQNMRNTKLPKHNTSGVMGVSWDRRSRRWIARISVHGRSRHIGAFREQAAAVAARKAADEAYGFHANHGRIA